MRPCYEHISYVSDYVTRFDMTDFFFISVKEVCKLSLESHLDYYCVRSGFVLIELRLLTVHYVTLI